MKEEQAAPEVEDVLTRATLAFEGDPELREELKAELRAHVKDSVEDGEACDLAEALERLGPVEEVAAGLESANRKRMRRRARMVLVMKGLILPCSLALALWVGWSEGRRLLTFSYPEEAEEWYVLVSQDEGNLWRKTVLGDWELRVLGLRFSEYQGGPESERLRKHWSPYSPEHKVFLVPAPPDPRKWHEDPQVPEVLNLESYFAEMREELAAAPDPKVRWMTAFEAVCGELLKHSEREARPRSSAGLLRGD